MDEVIKNEIHSAFAVYVHRNTGGFAYEFKDTDPDKLKELILIFKSEVEATLRNIYGFDKKEEEVTT